MNSKTCKKCGHAAPYESAPPLTCPNCGAVYQKVEAALRDQPAGQARTFQRTMRPVYEGHQEFAEQLRSESLYPAFRTVIKLIYIFGMVLTALVLVAGLFMATKSGPGAAVGGVIAAGLLFVIFKVSKEVSLMVADLSDAAVRLAANAERSSQ